MTTKEFNKIVEKDYLDKDLYLPSKELYPIMKYDEEYGTKKKSFEKIKFLSVGLNPSLTVDAKDDLDKILSQTSANRVKDLTDYQSKLKYVKPHQIQYFKLIDAFFTEITSHNSTFIENVFHYDFCQLRETNSKEVKTVIKDNFELLSEHFLQITQIVNPEVIFIFNGFLSSLLLEKKFTTPKPDKKNGCYFLKGMDRSPKIVLANQLSGGATSKVHKELLIWHSKRLINE